MNSNDADASIRPWPRVGEQLPKQTCGPLDGDALLRYAHVSGDDNPLHLDLAFARRAGLDERPVHGMLMMGQFEPMILAWRADLALTGLSSKFLRPVFAGQAFELSGRVARVSKDEWPSIVLRLMVHSHGDLALLGEATLRPRAQPVA